ncbi:hypothetical protein GCM10009753_30930 [Streptantibioticus ferralitis]
MPRAQAESAAAIGTSPANSPARSAPSRDSPAYHSRNAIAVSRTARYSSAVSSAAVGRRSTAAPSTARPVPANSGTAITVAYAEIRTGPSRGSNGMATSEKAASQASVPSAYSTPVGLAAPTPCTTAAPATTSAEAAITRGRGRRRASAGPTRASTSGVQPTTLPTAAGSAARSACTIRMLKANRPVPASTVSRASSRGVRRGVSGPRSRAIGSRTAAASRYRAAWPPDSG